MEQGCRFRFLVFDVDSPAAEVLDRSLGFGNRDLLELIRIQTSYIRDFQIALSCRNLSDRLEVRVMDVVPTFGLIEIDPGLRQHRMLVEVNGYRAEGALCPGFELADRADGWCGFFRDRALELWDNAKPLPLPKEVVAGVANPALIPSGSTHAR
jgi:hypothetical protein